MESKPPTPINTSGSSSPGKAKFCSVYPGMEVEVFPMKSMVFFGTSRVKSSVDFMEKKRCCFDKLNGHHENLMFFTIILNGSLYYDI